MDDFNDKIDLYQLILEIEDWLGIKHNPQILKNSFVKMMGLSVFIYSSLIMTF